MKKAITNIITGITEYVDMTAEEISEYEIYKAKADAEIALWLEQKKIDDDKKAAAEAKLAALGLTAEDLRVLGLS